MAGQSTAKYEKYKQVETRSVVVNGDFTPSLFQPYWFVQKGIISEADADSVRDLVTLENNVCQFQLGGWLRFTCTSDKMQLLTRMNPYFPVMKDFITALFKVCSEFPIKSFGYNFVYSFGLQSKERYYKIGSEVGNLRRWANVLEHAKLERVSVKVEDLDVNGSQFSLTIQPSQRDLKIGYGVDFYINNHFPCNDKNIDGGTLSELISSNYESYSEKSRLSAIKTLNEFLRDE